MFPHFKHLLKTTVFFFFECITVKHCV